MTQIGSELAATEQLSVELQDAGYEVIIEPSRKVIPAFLGNYRPDLIAFKDGSPTVIVEVKKRSPVAERYVRDIARLFEDRLGYEFRLHWISSLESEALKSASLDALEARVDELKLMYEHQLYAPALLVSWAMLEAISRILFPDAMAKPQRPASIVQKFASEGELSIDEAKKLRVLYKARNNIIHGVLDEQVTEEQILFFRGILLRLMEPVTEAFGDESA